MQNNSISVYIENLYDNFQSHLDSNKRIMFSGAYGIGKTYFLKHFFESKDDKYNVFHLFPVNYQVSQNEDIFELIKIDILYHILAKGWVFDSQESDKISKTLALQAYTINKSSSAFQSILKIFSMGKSVPVTEGLNEVEKIGTNFGKYYNELNEDNSLTQVRKYIDELQFKKGSIYEFDNITQLIYELLEKNKQYERQDGEGSGEKENILIIDDIDRIEPEHIFRILNVFSAHFDLENEDSNKFGFDKIVFVCDINNVRNIFSSRYGLNTDFNGYINKFFSSRIYFFENKEEIKKEIKNYLEYKLNERSSHRRINNVKNDIIQLVGFFIDSGTINIRHLKNLERIDFKKFSLSSNYDEFIASLPYIELLKVLLCVFNSDKNKLIKAFSYLNIDSLSSDYSIYKRNRYLSHVVTLLDYEKIRQNYNINTNNDNLTYMNKELDISFSYSIEYNGEEYYANIWNIGFFDTEDYDIENKEKNVLYRNYTKSITLFDIFDLFNVAIQVLNKNRILSR